MSLRAQLFGPRRVAEPVAPVDPDPPPFLEAAGLCPVCDQQTTFRASHPWLRDSFLCTNCDSVPRERALFAVLQMVRPDWRGLSVHESSPTPRSQARFMRECAQYVRTEYDPATPFGEMSADGAYRSENLEAQTFPDEAFDLVVTQDVFEHMFHPADAIREIARTLKPGGLHVCTVPLVNTDRASERRAKLGPDGAVVHLAEPQHHVNPIDPAGSLVTIDWGYDIAEHFAREAGLVTTIYLIDDLSRGIRGALNEVLVCRKQAPQPPGDAYDL